MSAVMAAPESTEPFQFDLLRLPSDLRLAVYEAIVGTPDLHIVSSEPVNRYDDDWRWWTCASSASMQNDNARLRVIACVGRSDVDFMAQNLHRLNQVEYRTIHAPYAIPGHVACTTFEFNWQPRSRPHSGWLALLRTGRLVYQEFIQVLYSRPRFMFQTDRDLVRFLNAGPRGGVDKRPPLRSLCIGFGQYPDRLQRHARRSSNGRRMPERLPNRESDAWRAMWSAIKEVSCTLVELEIHVTAWWGLRTLYRTAFDDVEEYRPLGDALRGIRMDPRGRITVVESAVQPQDPYFGDGDGATPTGFQGCELIFRQIDFRRHQEGRRLRFSLGWFLEKQARDQGLLDDSRNPPWHERFPETLAWLGRGRNMTWDERTALEALLLLGGGRFHSKPHGRPPPSRQFQEPPPPWFLRPSFDWRMGLNGQERWR